MDESCVFCRIVAGMTPSHQVFEDDDVIAFMDHRPLNPGHVLVIPKGHEPDLHCLDEPTYLAVMKVGKHLAEVLAELFEPPKVGLFVIGFHVPHVHVHVVPLYTIDDFTADAIKLAMRRKPDTEALAEICQRIREHLSTAC
uniref:Bis(5'-nucleosyl)-tetraphosphatase (Asymmetrical) n=1 Tax=Candidatus Entotheonella serta TaxID=1652106 RepID=A0A0K0PDD0_9BACT|nr:bis(5'-nucleosyl)-tetraphosphatase (asymmetrical) [Candidatus Entotheonella serta]